MMTSAPTLYSVEMDYIAANRIASLPARAAKAVIFAIAAVCVSGSTAVPLTWVLVFGVITAADIVVVRRYLGGATSNRAGAVLGFAGVIVFTMLPVWLAVTQGWPGRFMGALMAAGSMIQVLSYLLQSRPWMMLASVPSAIALVMIPFLPDPPVSPPHMNAVLGGVCVVLGLFVDVAWSTMENRRVFRLLTEAKEAAELAARSRQEFLDKMTHEFRTPLNAVINYAELLEEDLAGEGRADAERIKVAGKRLLTLVERVLTLSELAGQQCSLNPSETDLVEIVLSCIREHAPVAQANRTSIMTRLNVERHLNIDRAKVLTCIDVLISNACRFTRDGEVVVEASARGDAIVVSVTDTGPGLSPEQMTRLFEPFEQGDNSRQRNHEGAGLGLALAQQLARRMGGDLVVDPTMRNGARFTLRTIEQS